jgi:hypothetical protein
MLLVNWLKTSLESRYCERSGYLYRIVGMAFFERRRAVRVSSPVAKTASFTLRSI